MKKFFLLSLLCLFHFATRAQTGNISYQIFTGLQSGVTPNQTLLVTNTKGSDQFKLNLNSNKNFEFGVGMILPLKNSLYINPSIEHSSNTQNFIVKYSDLETRSEDELKSTFHQINLATTMGIKYQMFHLETGPIIGMEYKSESELEKIQDFELKRNQMQFGLRLNLGLSLLNRVKLDFQLQSLAKSIGAQNYFDGKSLAFNSSNSSFGIRASILL